MYVYIYISVCLLIQSHTLPLPYPPSTLLTVSFSMSVSLLYFVNQVICITFWILHINDIIYYLSFFDLLHFK